MDEDRELLLSFFPPGREALAAETGALKGRRRDKSPVALKKRLARSGPWRRDGIGHVAASGGRVMVRVSTGSLRFVLADGRRFDLRNAVSALDRPGSVASRDVATAGASVDGRVCAIRESDAAIGIALEKLRRKAARDGRTPKPQSLEFAKCVIVFTTFPASRFAPEAVLDWYRLRWQVELVFKRFKSVAQLGHLPKRGGEGSRAWLYGKLFAALLAERPIAHASALSPWGYDLQAPRSHPEPVARVQVRAGPGPTNDRAGHAPARGADGLAGHLPRSLGAAAKATPAERAILPRHGVRKGNQNKLTLMGRQPSPRSGPSACISFTTSKACGRLSIVAACRGIGVLLLAVVVNHREDPTPA